jgi:hypothetical protein
MTYLFPKTISEIRKTGGKFFPRYKNEAKDSTTRLALSPHNYDALEVRFQELVTLDDRLNDLLNQVRETREQRDRIWETELREPLMVAKKIVTICNPDSVVAVNNFGFESKSNATKVVPTERMVKNQAERLAVNVNALKEAQAIAQNSSAAISVTVNDVTKSTNSVAV